jgi:tetratricopeptide (TPR) repeat protein
MKNRIFVVVSVVTASFLTIVTLSVEATDPKDLDTAKKLFNDRKYDQAATFVRKLLDDDPRNGMLWDYYGRALDSQAESKKAIPAFTQSISLGYMRWRPYYDRGMAYSHLGNFETAVADMTTALHNEIPAGERSAVYCDRADAELSLKHYCDAAADYSMYIKTTTPDLTRYTHRARAYAGCGKLTEAIQDMSTFLAGSKKLKPRQIVGGYIYRAELYSKAKEYDKGISDLSAALKIDQDRPEIFRQRAKLYDSFGKKDLADKDRVKAHQIENKLYGGTE